VDEQHFPVADTYVGILTEAGMSRRPAQDLTVVRMALITGWVAAEEFRLAASRIIRDLVAAAISDSSASR
jgi:hypothetical protein